MLDSRENQASDEWLPEYRVFLRVRTEPPGMDSTRKGLRKGDLYKDNYERLKCSTCEKTLKKKNDPDEVFSVRTCPECGMEWKELR